MSLEVCVMRLGRCKRLWLRPAMRHMGRLIYELVIRSMRSGVSSV